MEAIDPTLAAPYSDPHLREILRRGREIYEREIRASIKAKNKGKFLAIDVNTGIYEIDEDAAAAAERLLKRHPDSEIFGLQIGRVDADSETGPVGRK